MVPFERSRRDLFIRVFGTSNLNTPGKHCLPPGKSCLSPGKLFLPPGKLLFTAGKTFVYRRELFQTVSPSLETCSPFSCLVLFWFLTSKFGLVVAKNNEYTTVFCSETTNTLLFNRRFIKRTSTSTMFKELCKNNTNKYKTSVFRPGHSPDTFEKHEGRNKKIKESSSGRRLGLAARAAHLGMARRVGPRTTIDEKCAQTWTPPQNFKKCVQNACPRLMTWHVSRVPLLSNLFFT